MCRIDDCEHSDAATTLCLRARKQHVCCECRRTIEPGEWYAKTTNLFEGHWDTFKTCAHCLVGQQWLRKNCGGWVFEQVAEEIDEHASEYPKIAPSLLRVARGIRKGWKHNRRLMVVPRMPASIRYAMKEFA